MKRLAIKLQQQCVHNFQPPFPGFEICSLAVSFKQGVWLQTVMDFDETWTLSSQQDFGGFITEFQILPWFLSYVMKKSEKLGLGQSPELWK